LPQPITVSQWQRPHRVMLARPIHAALIAAIASQWTEVEHQISQLLAQAFGSSLELPDGSVSMYGSWVAETTILEAETIRVRLKIIDATLGAVLKQSQSPRFAEWEALKKVLIKRSGERNTVVHGRWAISTDLPIDLILEQKDGSLLKYTDKDLSAVLDRLVEAWLQVRALIMGILEDKRAGFVFPGSAAD
jgi:hypothetical protein